MVVSNEAMTASGLFDEVPECLIETLLIVHGSGDRNSAEFTQVCERWTCILAPWIRIISNKNDYKESARWNGKWFLWYDNGQLWRKGVYTNGKKDGEWQWWHGNGHLWQKGVYANGNPEGEYRWWHYNGQLREKGVYVHGHRDSEWQWWHCNGQLATKGVYVNWRKEGKWQMWDENGAMLSLYVYHNGEHVTNQ